MRISGLTRHEDGYWTARVDGVAVDRRFGSWRITPSDEEHGFRCVLPGVAEDLQERVRKCERAENREAAV